MVASILASLSINIAISNGLKSPFAAKNRSSSNRDGKAQIRVEVSEQIGSGLDSFLVVSFKILLGA